MGNKSSKVYTFEESSDTKLSPQKILNQDNAGCQNLIISSTLNEKNIKNSTNASQAFKDDTINLYLVDNKNPGVEMSLNNAIIGGIVRTVIPLLLNAAVSANVPILGAIANVASQLYTLAIKWYDYNQYFKIFMNKVEMVLTIISNRVDLISQKIKSDDNTIDGFQFHFKNLIHALHHAKVVVNKFTTENKSKLSTAKSAVMQFFLADDFKEQMDSSSNNISETMIFLCFYAVLSPTEELSTKEYNKILRQILNNPFTAFGADTAAHIRRIPRPCRQWLIKELFDWKNNPIGSRIFFLQAEAGMGKSAFISSLLHYYKDMLNLLAVFYCKYGIKSRSDGAHIALSIAYQIAQTNKPYRDRLMKDGYAEEIISQIGSLNWGDIWDMLIVSQLEGLDIGDSSLIVIDALDEIGNTGDEERTKFLNFLINISYSLPTSIRLVVTGRPEPDIVEAFKSLNPFVIRKDDPNHIEDLKVFMSTQLSVILIDIADLNHAVQILDKRSNGTFVYLVLVIDPIVKRGKKLSLQELNDSLPDGIDNAYKREFSQIFTDNNIIEEKDNNHIVIDSFPSWKGIVKQVSKPILKDTILESPDKQISSSSKCDTKRESNHDVLNIIKLIVVMKRQLAIKEVSQFLQIEVQDVIEFSKSMPSMFPLRGEEGVADENKVFTVFHKSVLDWITNKQRSGNYYVDIKSAHNSFAERLLKQFSQSNDIEWKFPYECNSYYIYHLVDHLDGAGRQKESKQILMSLPWMMKTLEERGVAGLIGDFKSRQQYESRSTPRLSNSSKHNMTVDIFSCISQQSVKVLSTVVKNDFQIAFKIIMDALNLSHDILSKGGRNYPSRLPLQLYGRLNGVLLNNSYLNTLKNSCEKWFMCNLKFIPKRLYFEAPGGALESKFQFKESVRALVVVSVDGKEMIALANGNNIDIFNIQTGDVELTLKGHSSDVICLSALSDGRVVSGSLDRFLRVWNIKSCECERILKGHNGSVNCVSVLFDGRIVSGSQDSTLRVWNANSDECERVMEGHRNYVECVSVLPDGRVVSGSMDMTLRVWNIDDGKCIRVFEGHTGSVICTTVLRDGRVVSGGRDYSLRLWNVYSGECERVMEGHHDYVESVSVLPDGRVVSCSLDYSLRVWNTKNCKCERVLKGHSRSVYCVAVLPDGRIVSGSGDKFLHVWNIKNDMRERVMKGHSSAVTCVSIQPDGRVISGSDDKSLRLWNINNGECERILEGHIDSITSVTALNNEFVKSKDNYNEIIWNINTGREVLQHEYEIMSIGNHNPIKMSMTNAPYELSVEDNQELESYGIMYSHRMTSSFVTKDVIVWGYNDGNIIIFQRNNKL